MNHPKDDMPLFSDSMFLESTGLLSFEEIVAAREELVAMGLLRDSGRRKFEPRTGRFEIIWVATELAMQMRNKSFDEVEDYLSEDPN